MKEVTTRFLEACNFLIANGYVKNFGRLSGATGISRSQLSDIQSGRTQVGASTISKLVSIFAFIDSDWILTGEGKMTLISPEEFKEDIQKRFRECVDIVGKSYEEIALDISEYSAVDVKRNLRPNGSTRRFMKAFCYQYGFDIEWVLTGTGRMLLDNLRADKHVPVVVEKVRSEMESLRTRIDEVKNRYAELVRNGEDLNDELQGLEKLSHDFNLLYEKRIHELNPAYEKMTSLSGEDRELGKDFYAIEGQYSNSLMVDLGRREKALSVPFVDAFNFAKYPDRISDENFIADLPKVIFRVFDGTYLLITSLMGFLVTDESLDDGSKESILQGDIVIGDLWPKESVMFQVDRRNQKFLCVVVTRNAILFRRVRKYKDGYLHVYADLKNNSSSKLNGDEILEIYVIRHLERRISTT